MPNDTTITLAPGLQIPIERSGFSHLLATNPNYFGNLGGKDFKPVKVIKYDTTYEEVTCLGFNPGTNLLEAVVQIKLPAGYNGDSCTGGSYEYVRFYVDYGSGFQDLGYAAINVHDVANANDCANDSEKPLSFAASVTFQPNRNWCAIPVLPKVRAILSWQTIPPANTPTYIPVWGNQLDAHIQIQPRPLFLKEVGLNISGEVANLIPAAKLAALENQPVPLPNPGPLAVADLVKLYAATDKTKDVAVPTHRFTLPAVQAVLNAPAVDTSVVVSAINDFKAVGIDWGSVIAAMDGVNADVSWEQIECLGLEGDPYASRLVATLRIKKPIGYNGGLCTAGSTEYVAFWADWDDDCQFTYLQTVGVQVHDISTIPADGLVYTVVLPVDLDPYRNPCGTPKIARIHAVLSWATPPSTTDPFALNTYGNAITTHVQIQPGTIPNPLTPTISILGGIPTSLIGSNGYTVANAHFAGNNLIADSLGRPCPFGGVVEIQGPQFPGYNYKIQVRPMGGTWQDVTQPLMLTRSDGTTFMSSPDAQNFFTYQQYPNNIENLLGEWVSSGDLLWEVKLQIADLSDNPVPGATTDTHMIQLDNTAPVASVNISNNGDCGQYLLNTTLTGTYVATDANFGSFSMFTAPFPGAIIPASGSSPTPSGGSSWSLNTTGLPQCGYVIWLEVADLSIVDSVAGLHNTTPASVGFCLLSQLPPAS